MNWGNRLLLVFAVFASLMMYMVYQCMHTSVNLVSKEYYKDEIAYQTVIDGSNNANALATSTTIVQNQHSVQIQLPKEMSGKLVNGTVFFYCPSNSENDQHFALQTNEQGMQEIDKNKLKKGNYTVKIDWVGEGHHYYSEQPFRLNL